MISFYSLFVEDARLVAFIDQYLYGYGRKPLINSFKTWAPNLRPLVNSTDDSPAEIIFQINYLYTLSVIILYVSNSNNCNSLRIDRLYNGVFGYHHSDSVDSELFFQYSISYLPSYFSSYSLSQWPIGQDTSDSLLHLQL